MSDIGQMIMEALHKQDSQDRLSQLYQMDGRHQLSSGNNAMIAGDAQRRIGNYPPQQPPSFQQGIAAIIQQLLDPAGKIRGK